MAQTGVLDPTDTVVIYNSSNPPSLPASNTLAKWVKTNRFSWSSTSFKCYIYNGLQFRLKFPKSYSTAVDGKTYPMYVFFHGVGEKGTVYDNEYQLYHGGQNHMKAVDAGTFDGFLFYPQSSAASGGWSQSQIDNVYDLIMNYFVPQIKVDINRVIVSGLSGGGSASWLMLQSHPTLAASAVIMSAASISDQAYVSQLMYMPIWLAQGGKDKAPAPPTTLQLVNAFNNAGGNLTYHLYSTLGHGTWDSTWVEPTYFPFLNRAHQANPWVVGGRTEYCPTDTINATLGLTAGFDGYQWRKDGAVITGATSNTLNITAAGVYDARILRGSTWSTWSPIPDTIKIKGATVSPTISVKGLASTVLPATDGSTTVTLQVPDGYASYTWARVDTPATLSSTSSTVTITGPGSYAVLVTEKYGCSSSYSTPFVVVNANGIKAPSIPQSPSATTLSQTKVKLNWSETPNPPFMETQFEIYQATAAAGPYTLIGFSNALVDTFIATGLNTKTAYYYKIRAINATAASAATTPVSATTFADTIAPTAPVNLRTGILTKGSIQLLWDSATDDAAVTYYDIYINGVKSYTVPGTQDSLTVWNLIEKQSYAFAVKARDFAGNISPFSNQLTAQPGFSGLTYGYFTDTWVKLPDFTTLTPDFTGTVSNVSLDPAVDDENYGFLYKGYFVAPVAGTYNFQTISSAASKLFIDKDYSYTATATVASDGNHTSKTVTSANLTLTAGVHTFALGYYQGTGTPIMQVKWKNPQTNNAYVLMPDSAFVEKTSSGGAVPKAPSALKAVSTAYNKVKLTWTNNDSTQMGTEVYRASSSAGPWVTLGRALGNTATTFTDSTVQGATNYFYEVKAINQYGPSKFNGQDSTSLAYAYYEISSVSKIPDFTTLIPKTTGTTTALDLSTIANRGTYWAVSYKGFINITTAGTYTFSTTSDDGSNLYVDGTKVVNNDGGHSSATKTGTISLTVGRHALQVDYMNLTGGYSLSVSYTAPGGTKVVIPVSAYVKAPVSVTTLALPGAPATPTAFTATATSSRVVCVSWKDSATVALSYKLYRSTNNNSSYVLIATRPATNGLTIVGDTSLFPNSTYYYKLVATNNGGNSPYTAELSVTMPDSIPQIAALASQTIRWGTTVNMNVTAISPVNDQLSLVFTGLPAFATVNATGNGTATLSFSPAQTDTAVYTITATATDQHSGTSSKSFMLTVNSIYNPVISGISNVTVAEGGSSTLALSATDQNPGDSVRWRFSGLPSFVTPVITGSTVTLKAAPGYSDAGTYTAAAIAYGGVGGVDSETFTITVGDMNPNKSVYVAFNNGTRLATGIWNNTAKTTPTLNDVFGPFKDSTGTASTVGIKITSSWQGIGTGSNTAGVSTGNNSGVYPDVVISQAYWSSTVQQTFNLTGLDTAKNKTYTLTFMGSRASVTDNRTGTYTVNGQSVSLNAAGNYLNTVSLSGLKPAADGTMAVAIKNATGSSYVYLNAMVIQSVYNDSTAPVAPKNLAAVLNAAGTSANLSWTASAYNDTAYQVYRATDTAGTYTLLGKTAAHASGYTDSTIVGNVTYYYKVAGVNKFGTSAFAGPIQLVVPNKAPVLVATPDQSVKGDTSLTVSITASYTPNDSIWISALNLPSFATLTDLGHGSARIVIAPTNAQVGIYNNIVLVAKDNFGGIGTDTLNLVVKDKAITSTYINFNQTNAQGSPWNNFNSAPLANVAISNAIDENGSASGIGTTLTEAWSGTSAVGATTGNNSGVFPDNVMLTTYYDNSGSTKHIKLTGLKTTNKYNLVFFASRVASDARITYFSVGTDTVGLNVSGNTSTTVQLNGKSPDSTGTIIVSVNKASAAPYAYINAMVIQSYVSTGVPLDPANLTALGTSRTNVKLGWSDRSDNETAFEIWRAPIAAGTKNLAGAMVLIDTVAANVTSYNDKGVSSGSNYMYQVRAKSGAFYSGYSNAAYAATVQYQAYINFNRDNPAGAPWNNTNGVPELGKVYQGLVNDSGYVSGMNMTIVNNFSGDNPFGVNTGNNSGIYPDNVIDKTWWTDAGMTATLKIDGLNQAMTYNFVFFASRSTSDALDRSTQYTINGSSAYLNATNNSSQTTQINNIVPDSSGSVSINISNAPTSSYGYLGAMVIQAANSFNAPVVLNGGRTGVAVGATDSRFSDSASATKLRLYPNPFASDLYLDLNLESSVAKLAVRVLDMSGSPKYYKELSNLAAGENTIRLGLDGSSLARGVYFVEVLGLPGGKTKVIKVLKQ